MNNDKHTENNIIPILLYIIGCVILIGIIGGMIYGALWGIEFLRAKEERNLVKAEKLIENELGINKKFIGIDLLREPDFDNDYFTYKVQTKAKEYKVILYSKEIKGIHEPSGIKNIIQIK